MKRKTQKKVWRISSCRTKLFLSKRRTTMRVVTGEAKGCKLKTPKTVGTRPIMDRVKTALFDILSTQVEDACFLDLFAGTGSVGIEALSRGAQHATFIEMNAKIL